MNNGSAEQAADCVVRGITKANFEYERLSTEWISERGVESYVAYFVATELRQQFIPDRHFAVLLEVSVKEFEEYYVGKVRVRGRRSRHRFKGNRLDVVVVDRTKEEWRAVGVVELKRNEVFRDWASDVDRIAQLVRNYGHKPLEWGCFASFVCEERRKPWIQDKWNKEWRPYLQSAASASDLSCTLIAPTNAAYAEYENEYWRFAIVGAVYRPKVPK